MVMAAVEKVILLFWQCYLPYLDLSLESNPTTKWF